MRRRTLTAIQRIVLSALLALGYRLEPTESFGIHMGTDCGAMSLVSVGDRIRWSK
jgi:hypothetical protein